MSAEPNPPSPDHNGHVQMNVRVPRTMRDTIDNRRASLGLSRDEWVRRAITWALRQPPGTPVTGQGRRTAPRPEESR